MTDSLCGVCFFSFCIAFFFVLSLCATGREVSVLDSRRFFSGYGSGFDSNGDLEEAFLG